MTPRVLRLNLDAVKGLLGGFITIRIFSENERRKKQGKQIKHIT